MVRLLHDATFVERLHADPAAALAGVDLSAGERASLLAVPRAAWRADAARAARLVAGLAEEFPAAAALAPDRLDAFVASDAFHRAIADGSSLAAALGAHLATGADPHVGAVARLEAAIAEVRRAPRRVVASPGAMLRLTPHAVLLDVPSGVSTWRAAVLAVGSSAASPTADDVEHLLVLRTPADEVTVEALSDELAALLRAGTTPTPRTDLIDLAVSLGATAHEAAEIVDALAADGLLV
jgi:hypothetical protein